MPRLLTAVTMVALVALSHAACGDDGEEATDNVMGWMGSTPTTVATGSQGSPGSQAGGAGGAGHADHMGNPTSTCSPSGPSLTITASGTKFDKDCLAAPASQAFTITYDNKDGLPHNLAILESHTATDVLFRADIFQGPKVQTFNVAALRPGTYAFHCEVHPNFMSGTFIVK